MAVIFLDQDDEITTAIARLRASEDIKVALVLAPGSRLGTSRINFRLLAREAQGLPRQASIVTTEAGVRAIAVSAGLPAYASVAEYEAAIKAAASAAATSVAGAAAAVSDAAEIAAPGEAGAPVAAEPAVPGEAGESVAAEPPAPAEADASGEAAAVTAASAAAAGLVPQPPLEAPPTAPAKRSRSSKKADKGAAAAIAAGAATGDVAQTGVPPSAAVEGEPAPVEPVQGGAGVGGPDEPTVVTDAAILGAGGEAAETTRPLDSADATAAADAAAASAFGAEIAAVPPPPRGPGPRSSAALPVVGGPVRSTGVLGGRGALVGVLAVIAAVGVVAIALAVLVLPQATITVAPPIEQVGPVSLTVTADPTAIEPDAATGIIPAQLVSIRLAADDEFTATGVKITESSARGTVTFSNSDTSASNTVAGGSIVATSDNVRFRTLGTVVVPKAKFQPTFRPGLASVRVEAVKPGPGGNVPADAITRIPAGESSLLSVTNASATSGGQRTESVRVAQEDVDVAVAELTRDLEDQMAAALADPATAPDGTTIIEETAEMGEIKARPAPDNLVGRSVSTFSLALSAAGEVIAVDTGVLEPLASDALTAAVPEGSVLFSESITTTVGSPTVDGGVVSFEIGATGQAWRPLDEVALLEQVRGRSVLEAEDALTAYGEVAIDVWPFYVATIPEGDRATLTVIPPTPSGP